ncbi:penicillin-binding protein 2 [Campylobacter canadensis]|uniref:penicillin-binding transpeptidase domain-containing protein n=1 Tax=Campylobacter canadensis TaxID=449520 RepID=UPI001CCA3BCC|nr:penicillin-binding protein 2 [Campylobacter canadensis]MBZ7996136.1 penicillin-binding protein 2 [Campylobacter canadensis]MBZ8001567.1 penicillin-binding protein 2 [Campylobacter canadensis]MBZ8003339.1 penicillin-binding protein 2 [Campylobacter canadensis]
MFDSKRVAVGCFLAITFSFFLLILAIFSRYSHSNSFNLEKGERIRAIRGDIISSDGYTLVTSKKTFRAEIDLRSLDFDKLDYFLKLFGIYAFIDNSEIKKIKENILKAKKRNQANFVLSKDIDEKAASYLQELAQKINYSNIFKAFENKNKKIETRGLSIVEHKEDREFLKYDTLTPILGYSQLDLQNNIFANIPKKGLEKYYDDCLRAQSDYKISGIKGIGKNIVINKNSFLSSRIDGCKLYLNINLKLQKALERIASIANKEYDSKEVIIGVLNSDDASILALATSKRYDPYNRKSDLSYLNSSAVEFSYEPGSVIKPIAFANLLKLKRITPYELVKTYGGRYKLDRFTITDTHPMDSMIAEDIIVYSSNIGMVQISNKESVSELIDGYKEFNIGEKTGIDLPYEKAGFIKAANKTYDVEKNTMAYGYGFSSTFIQLLAAYNVFNNYGTYKIPKLAKAYSINGVYNELDNSYKKEVLPLEIAKQMNRILIKVANQKSLEKFWPIGINVGGKTGTARVNINGAYTKDYNANFFGFANDLNHRYTIGVLVISPNKDKKGYYAAQTALPVAALVINQLVEDAFLEPNYK